MRRSINVLVLVLLLLVVGGLVLPAVARVREAAARIQCSNNLKQLALGLHNYHENLRQVPRGDYLQRELRQLADRNHPPGEPAPRAKAELAR
jgi:hypothetical protein